MRCVIVLVSVTYFFLLSPAFAQQIDDDQAAIAPFAIPQSAVLSGASRGLCVCQDPSGDLGLAGILSVERDAAGETISVRCQVVRYGANGNRQSVSPCDQWVALVGQMPDVLPGNSPLKKLNSKCSINDECESGFCSNESNRCSIPLFGGLVTNEPQPHMPGGGVDSAWSFGADEGISAGNAMCVAAGFDHVCTYQELLDAEAEGSTAFMPDGASFWLHRVNVAVLVNDVLSPPGPGGRCSSSAALEDSWTELGNHVTDGEFGMKNGGNLVFAFDQDTAWTGDSADNHQGHGPYDGGLCGGVLRAITCCNMP